MFCHYPTLHVAACILTQCFALATRTKLSQDYFPIAIDTINMNEIINVWINRFSQIKYMKRMHLYWCTITYGSVLSVKGVYSDIILGTTNKSPLIINTNHMYSVLDYRVFHRLPSPPCIN